MLLDALYCNVDHRFLLSFPTRRSSDLYAWAQARYPHLPAKAQAVKAILDGAKLGFEQGLPNERSIFLELVQSDRKSTRLNSSHVAKSYAVFCLKKKKEDIIVEDIDSTL